MRVMALRQSVRSPDWRCSAAMAHSLAVRAVLCVLLCACCGVAGICMREQRGSCVRAHRSVMHLMACCELRWCFSGPRSAPRVCVP